MYAHKTTLTMLTCAAAVLLAATAIPGSGHHGAASQFAFDVAPAGPIDTSSSGGGGAPGSDATMTGGGAFAGLITLCPDCQCAFDVRGDDEIIVAPDPHYECEVAIQVNSSDPCAACVGGSAVEIHAHELNMVGDLCTFGHPTIDGDVNPGSPALPDPLAGIPQPPCDGPVYPTVFTDGTPNNPGTYPNGIRTTSAGETVVLQPGTYCLDGEGIYVNGGDLIAHGVTLYVLDSTPGVDPHSAVYLGGNGIIEITPATSGDYEGISVFEARDNTNESTIIGTSNMILEGTFDFPVAPLEIGGTGTRLGNLLIAWTLYIHGTGEFVIPYDGSFAQDCNTNCVPDEHDITEGTSEDCNTNVVPDECEPDTDGDGLIDGCDACYDSIIGDTIVIDGCDTGVANLMPADDGCTMADLIRQCAETARQHGAFVSCVAHLSSAWPRDGLTSGRERGSILRCAAQADLP